MFPSPLPIDIIEQYKLITCICFNVLYRILLNLKKKTLFVARPRNNFIEFNDKNKAIAHPRQIMFCSVRLLFTGKKIWILLSLRHDVLPYILYLGTVMGLAYLAQRRLTSEQVLKPPLCCSNLVLSLNTMSFKFFRRLKGLTFFRSCKQ